MPLGLKNADFLQEIRENPGKNAGLGSRGSGGGGGIFIVNIILVGCAQTGAVLDESMVVGMGDRWDFILARLID